MISFYFIIAVFLIYLIVLLKHRKDTPLKEKLLKNGRILLWLIGIYILGFILIAILAHVFPRPIPPGNYMGGYWGELGFAWLLLGFFVIIVVYPTYLAVTFSIWALRENKKKKLEIRERNANREQVKVSIINNVWVCPSCNEPNNKINDICEECGQSVIKEQFK